VEVRTACVSRSKAQSERNTIHAQQLHGESGKEVYAEKEGGKVKQKKYYPPEIKLCIDCYYARMRTDICGIYCTGGFIEKDGTCKKFKPYRSKEDVS